MASSIIAVSFTRKPVIPAEIEPVSSLYYGGESWTLYSRQERRLNTFHMCNLRQFLGMK